MGRYWRVLRVGVIASDVLAVLAAHSLSAGLRFGSSGVALVAGLSPVYPVIVVVVALLIVGLGWQYGTYRRWALFGGHRVYPMLLTIATFGLVAIIFLSYFLGGPPVVSRAWLIASWLFTVILLSASRLLWRQVALRWQGQGLLVRNVLIAGANQHGILVAQQLNSPQRHGRNVVGFLDDYQRPGTEVIPGLAVVAHPSNVLECARELGAEEIIIIAGALSWESHRHLAELVTSPACPLDARISPTFYDLLTTSAELSHIAYIPMVTLNRARLSGLNGAAKRLLDLAVACVMLAVLTPLWAYWRVVAWTRGLAMLRQEPVLGFAGRQFEVVGLTPGLTRSPIMARLPALWNVLWGDLSLVGPRPIRAREVQEHDRWLANLFAMRPGLTGLWRVRDGEVPVEERVALDLYYVRNYTLSLDGQILLNTARQLVRRLLGGEAALTRWYHTPPAPARGGQPVATVEAAVAVAHTSPRHSDPTEVRH